MLHYTLGVVNYGFNNIVSGVITLFSFLNCALGAFTSRFLTFELGRNDRDRLKKVFRTAFNIHAALAIIVVIFCETAGLWIVNHVLVISPERLFACNIIYQYVVVSALLSITQVPMNAQIFAHERIIAFSDASRIYVYRCCSIFHNDVYAQTFWVVCALKIG